MPVKPDIKALNANSVQILNAIRANATENYRNFIPKANENSESIKAIGAIMMQYQPLQNEFLSALVNRIGRVLITSKMYRNPWAFLKRGYMEFGETLEEIFVNLAKPHDYDPEVAETQQYKREIPDVRAAFHTMNYQKFYKATIQNNSLRQAFLSWNGITDLIARIVDAMYTGAAYDEFQTMKYLLARHILDGHIAPVEIPAVDPDGKLAVTTIKEMSDLLTFMSTDYNIAGVQTFTDKSDQYVILSAKYSAKYDVDVLSAAFNMDKVEFMGRRILIDSFGSLDTSRLQQLFGNDPTFQLPTAAELALLDAIPVVMVDRQFFMILDNFQDFTEKYNGEGLYWNYWYHVWKTFSVSPFHNALVFVAATPAVTSVTVSPAAVTIPAGYDVTLSATVATTGFASQAVNWAASAGTITNEGVLSTTGGSAGDKITVTATSVFDPTKSGTATVTLS